MMDLNLWKQELIAYCIDFIDEQIHHIQEAINSAQDSSNVESKSSAGDKHETGKSLMQLEQENNAQHLLNMSAQKRVISLIQNQNSSEKVGLGSLVETTNGYYFLAIGIGKVDMGSKSAYIISPGSPVGKLLYGKSVGQAILLNGKSIKICNIA